MAKSTKNKMKVMIDGEVIDIDALRKGLRNLEEKTFDITEASLKDEFCNYKYQITRGVGLGDKHKVDGSGRVQDSLLNALAALTVHLAFIDDAFKDEEMQDIDQYHTDEITQQYRIVGFKVKGSGSSFSVSLQGNKFVAKAQGRMGLDTPFVAIDSLSSYKWWNELKAAVEAAQEEVSLYKLGNYIEMKNEDDEPKKDSNQLTIADQLAGKNEGSDDEFENAKV